MKALTRLIEVDDLIKLVNLAILTGRIKNAKPISMLLIADTETFQQCLTQLAEGRRSPTEFETAKQHLSDIVAESVHRLRSGSVSLTDLEYRVELREEPAEKLMSKRLAQPYQAAWLLTHQGKAPTRGDTIGFVKVLPFRLAGRQFTVKPTSQANPKEIDVGDYALSLYASLSQAFDPMNIKLATNPTSLSNFV